MTHELQMLEVPAVLDYMVTCEDTFEECSASNSSSSRSGVAINYRLPSLSSSGDYRDTESSKTSSSRSVGDRALHSKSQNATITSWLHDLRRVQDVANSGSSWPLEVGMHRETLPDDAYGEISSLSHLGAGSTCSSALLRVDVDRPYTAGYVNRDRPSLTPSATDLKAKLQTEEAQEGLSTLVKQVRRETFGLVSIEKLQNLEIEGLLARIPRHESGELASVGSLFHDSVGGCSPCAYWFKGICKYSVACTYCHFLHHGQKSKRLRPSKQVRMRMRRWRDAKQELQFAENDGHEIDKDDDEDGGSSQVSEHGEPQLQ